MGEGAGSRRRSQSRAVPGCLGLAVIVALFSFAAEARADADRDKSVCPPGATSSPTRTRAVLRRVRSQPRGKALLLALGRPPVVCYGKVSEGTLQTDGALVLQEDRPVAANAARAGHLLHHLVHGLPLDQAAVRSDPRTCAELVSRADRAERAAHALENDLRHAFRLAPLAFEDLSDAYRQRCEALRPERPSRPAM